MFRFLASGLLTRGAARRLGRVIPNPLVRAVAVTVAGYAINNLVHRVAARRRVRTA